MKWCTFFFAVLPVALLAQAGPQPDKIGPKIARHEAGIICAPPTTGISKAPDTVAGTTHLIDVDPPFVSLKRHVPAVIGIGFGVKSQAFDPAGIEGVSITISHPAMGDAGATVQSFGSRISGLDPSLTFYQFDFDYELVTGIWQMQAMQGDTVLYRTTFEVLPPDQVPELARACGFEELLS
ncbi:MAG: DUF3859 domain-containing protein [Yoonia sp.]|nr:DUF3859 domain-containing protein [Yoonia sp.]